MDATIVIDPALGNSTAIRLRGELEHGQWQNADALLENLRDWDERAFLVAALAEWPGRPTWLDEWYRKRSLSSDVPGLVRGVHSIFWAWEARGSQTGDKVSNDGFRLFLSRLQAAERDLEEAAFKAIDDPTPWAFLITTGMGRQAGAELIRRRFEQATKRDPHNYAAHSRMLVSLTEKWGGSHEAMFRFAHEAAARAPAGSGLHVLVASAHIERWLAYGMAKDLTSLSAYFQQDEVKREILSAREKFLEASPLAPSFAIGGRNTLAFALWQCRELTLAGEEIKAIGSRVSRLPWQFRGDPATVFAKARAECLGLGDEAVERKMKEQAHRAVEAAEKNQVTLDFSWESLVALDKLLRIFHAELGQEAYKNEKRRNEAIFYMGLGFGGYVGEVMRQRYGGCWLNYADGADSFDPALFTRGKYCHPMKVVAYIVAKGGPRTVSDVVEQMLSGGTDAPPAQPPDPNATAASDTALPEPSPETVAPEKPAPTPPSAAATSSLSEKMRAAADSIVTTARERNLGELNYEEASLPTLDKLIAGLRNALQALPEAQQRISAAKLSWTTGAYVGEVICRAGNGFWRENVSGVSDGVPVVDTGNALALTIPAMLGLLTDDATQLGAKRATSASEYYREIRRLQKEWLSSRIQGPDSMEQLPAAISDDPSLANQLINVLATALLTASLKWGLDLDFSEASLDGLDSLLEQLHKIFVSETGPPPSDQQVANMAMLWGVYLGEVIRRNRGGRWSYRAFSDGKRALQVGSGEQAVFPLSRAEKQIRSGAEFSVRAFYQWTGGLSAPSAGGVAPPSPEIRSFASHVSELALQLMPAEGVLSPFLAFAREGKISIESYVGMSNEKAISMGRKRASEQAAETLFVAVVYDGYVCQQNEKKKDAILMETHERGLPTGFIFGQCYARQAGAKAAKSGELGDISHCAAYLGSSS